MPLAHPHRHISKSTLLSHKQMKIGRAVLSGSLVWLFVFIVFTVLSFVPGIQDSTNQQGIIIGILILPFA